MLKETPVIQLRKIAKANWSSEHKIWLQDEAHKIKHHLAKTSIMEAEQERKKSPCQQ